MFRLAILVRDSYFSAGKDTLNNFWVVFMGGLMSFSLFVFFCLFLSFFFFLG